ncbi:hypothetical protein ARMSODRAFT_1018832 [Armillaria solidipes]|uniref:Uncharacterized protein n=1 Tax=Armillaria solidipes TaxID=1076256 RepID=A0A2H3BR24_9AGAR|nr:hypothetical protein ARMSODRAFT_1018832 [Armillaria solidipes]
MKKGNVITAVALPTDHDSAVLAFITNATYFEHCGALLPVIFMKNLQATMVDMRPPRLRQSQHYPFPEVEPSGFRPELSLPIIHIITESYFHQFLALCVGQGATAAFSSQRNKQSGDVVVCCTTNQQSYNLANGSISTNALSSSPF